jgi:DNA-binding CsgD family transcriptional regulator
VRYIPASMRNYWPLTPQASAAFEIPLAQVTGLLQKLGLSGRHAVAEDLLRLVGGHVPLAQCTIFSFEGQARPRIVAVGDRARTEALPRISQDYITRFYPLDGSVRVMQAELAAAQRASAANPLILLHRQKGTDVTHREYREICYELPQVAERLAILALQEGSRWLSVNFYRGIEHGPFDARSIAVIEAFAPLVVHAVRLHYAGQVVNHDLAELMLARLLRRCPGLTKRDLDVVRGLLSGLATEGIADRMGIELSSAQTYLKRVYRKLGISGQRELLGLLMEPEPAP